MKKTTRRLSKLFVLFSLSTFVVPEAYSHDYWGDEYDYLCDDAHSIRDKKDKQKKVGFTKMCFDVPEGTYRVEDSNRALWEKCPVGSYCPGGSAGKIKPDKFSTAPDEGMSKPQSCPTNQLSDRKRLICEYPKNLSKWDTALDTIPKNSKYKDGKLVCKKGMNYSRQKGKCR